MKKAPESTRIPTKGWLLWVPGGSIAMAILAVAALAMTLLAAHQALQDASEVVVRGEGNSLATTLNTELRAEGVVLNETTLQALVAKHDAQGLRYLAVRGRGGDSTAIKAGTARISQPAQEPDQLTIAGRRVRLTSRLAPPPGPRGDPNENRDGPPPAEGGPHPFDDRPPPPFVTPATSVGAPPWPPHAHPSPPLLVIEFEPPVIATLRTDLARVVGVGAVAASVLIAFAIAWFRSSLRLSKIERQAAREQRLVALGQMASVMAHELRNPLASIKGHAQLLGEDEAITGRVRDKVSRLVRDAERLELLTTSLLDFVRDGPIDARAIAPSELLTRALEDLPAARVRVDLERAPKKIFVDDAGVARALQNLVQNAFQASADDRHVDVCVAATGADVVITVRDYGPGLPVGSEARIFEPFVTTRVRGTGLGLPIARRIAQQHGGSLEAETLASGGAAFRLVFPRAARDL